jgi:N-acetylmuramoyl-L-alanine amidase-like
MQESNKKSPVRLGDTCLRRYDSQVFRDYQEKINLRIVKIAEGFLGQKYVGGVLEENETESCVINPFELDCVTMIEQSLALARIYKYKNIKKENIIDKLIQELTFIRYRNGKLNGYLSRLHYSKDWALDNINKNIVEDIGRNIGGEKYKKKINFMSSHPQYYSKLKNNKNLVDKVKILEEKINSENIYYIPKDKLSQNILDKIESGDLIFFTTNIEGLDYSHTAIARRDDDVLAMIHASASYKKVVVEKSLLNYINSVKKITGITVLRVL